MHLQKLRHISQVLAVCAFIALPLAAIFGRKGVDLLLKSPTQGIILSLLLLTLAAYYSYLAFLARKELAKKIPAEHTRNYLAFALLTIPCSALAVHTLISHPIEYIHLVKYSGITVLVFFALNERSLVGNLLSALFVVAFGGFCEELMQGFVPNRIFDPMDIAVNFLSALFGLGLICLALWLLSNSPTTSNSCPQ